MINSFLYIDPGTGSMLFTIIIGIVSALFFAVRDRLVKLKFLIHGGKAAKTDRKKLPYVIFSDNKRYWNVFSPICDEFEKRGIEVSFFTASSDDPALEKDYRYVHTEYIGEGNKPYARLNMLNACVLLATTPGLDVYQWKRSKNTDFYIHTYHAVGDGTDYRMFALDFYDAVLLTGSIQENYIRSLEEKRGTRKKELVMVGSTYLDAMAERKKRMEDECEENHCEDINDKMILVAPTWGASSILNRYGEKILAALIKTGYHIVVRPHPQSYTSDAKLLEELKEKFPDGDRFSWNRDNDNFDILSKADVLITDYSGVMYDYMFIFDRPIIYADTNIDNSPFDAAWIEEDLWHLAILPELGLRLDEKDFDNIKSVIDSVSDSEKLKKSREKRKLEAWQNEGRAAVNTVDYMVEKYKSLQK